MHKASGRPGCATTFHGNTNPVLLLKPRFQQSIIALVVFCLLQTLLKACSIAARTPAIPGVTLYYFFLQATMLCNPLFALDSVSTSPPVNSFLHARLPRCHPRIDVFCAFCGLCGPQWTVSGVLSPNFSPALAHARLPLPPKPGL